MAVDVELFGQLGLSRPKHQSFEIEMPLPVSAVALLAGVPAEEIGLATIDGVQVPLTALVPATCRLSLFAPMSGG